ncbi:MAG: ribonuclease J [Acholeplasmatales bacterium]|nr:ribonuclease J [Acholeplasmatales bacterium]
MEKQKTRDDIKIFALGGLGEVGKNMYCIEFRNQLFVIDAGILFPDEHLLGVDYVIPDFTYLKEHQEQIVGLFITHGHEDHIGGIPFLLKQVKIPKIYAAGVTVDLIENKLEDYPELLGSTQIVEFKSHFVYQFDGIELSFARISHSIPDSFAFLFKTPFGYIVHTGDFKIDLTPVGPGAELEKFAKVGNEGVLCMLADSTNALREGFTESERKIGDSIKELFSRIEDRIIVATFASNMYRVQQIIEACIATNRKVAVFGRSMEKTIEVGQQVGYIKAPKGTIVLPEDINNYKPSEMCLLCTGSQGEPLAALSRVAAGSHKIIKLIPSDTIIFSSNPIPGNQEGVNRTINQLFKQGANVITHSPIADTHTTGHGSQGELKLMLTLIRPKYFIPVHGEYRMQRVHADLAIETGTPKENTFILSNGDTVIINENEAYKADKVQAGDVYIAGTGIGDVSSTVIKERKALSDDGMFAVIVTIDSKKKTIPIEPQVVSRGFIYMKDSEALTKDFVDYSKKFIQEEMIKSPTVRINYIKTALTEKLAAYIVEKTDRHPIVIPVFMDIA